MKDMPDTKTDFAALFAARLDALKGQFVLVSLALAVFGFFLLSGGVAASTLSKGSMLLMVRT